VGIFVSGYRGNRADLIYKLLFMPLVTSLGTFRRIEEKLWLLFV
jgi:hypothetical protein